MHCNHLQLTSPVRSVEIPKTGQRGVRHDLSQLGARIFDVLMNWQERAAQRAHLSRLDDHILSDVGLTRDQIARETDKPFWRA